MKSAFARQVLLSARKAHTEGCGRKGEGLVTPLLFI